MAFLFINAEVWQLSAQPDGAVMWLTVLLFGSMAVAFLAVFSGLYFTVGVLTDENYREQFFAEVLDELERAVGVRAVHLALRELAGESVSRWRTL